MSHKTVYPYDATECRFLLGGIGTGNISVGTRGNFCDWEIYGKQGKGNYFPYTFAAIWAKPQGGEAITRVLESRIHAPYTRSHGFLSSDGAGLPRLKSSSIYSQYPFVTVDFEDDTVPFEASLTAFTPLLPLNVDDSSIPGAVLRYTIRNRTDAPLDVTTAFSLANGIGFTGYGFWGEMMLAGTGKNEYREENGARGLYYTCPSLEETDLKYGSMSLMTTAPDITFKEEWLDGVWADAFHDFWDDFTEDGLLERRSQNDSKASVMGAHSPLRVGSLGIRRTLQPGESADFEYVLTWHFPNRIASWFDPSDEHHPALTKNYYATLRSNAWEYGQYLLQDLERLEGTSRTFADALYNSTLPGDVIDSLANNITILRSPTCFRIEDGTFLTWEGCFPQYGSCDGNCTHVWNYAQTAAFLFPTLEHSMRNTEFNIETDDDGKMEFRARRIFNDPEWAMLPAADGQMGCIVRLYRDWKLSGDRGLLEKMWPKASKALDFAFTYWDTDGDYVLDSRQHNTYDIEFYGPNSLTNTMFLAALKAGAAMAEELGDLEHAETYRKAFEIGSKNMDQMLWNGEYYAQNLEDVNEYRYQYGDGCLSDQVLGQMLAHLNGLGYILPEDHMKKAVLSIFRANFRPSMAEHHNVQRTYALNDEAGLLLCSWPRGGRPKLPFVYSDEVWAGIEYQVAAHLIYEGYVDEGLTIVKAVRDRYNGFDWNPWNEIECGYHYIRSMASWSLLTALSGYTFHIDQNKVAFAPRINEDDFHCFFSNAKCWGIYHQERDASGNVTKRLEVLYGDPVELDEV